MIFVIYSENVEIISSKSMKISQANINLFTGAELDYISHTIWRAYALHIGCPRIDCYELQIFNFEQTYLFFGFWIIH